MANYYLSSRAYEDITPWGGQQNMLLQSNSFTTTWTATNCTPSQSGTDADPFGTSLAWRLTDNTTTTVTHGVSQGITKAATALRYMFSFYAKVGPTLTRVRASIGDSNSVSPTNGYFATFDLTNGNVGVQATIIGAGFTLGLYKIEPVFGRTGWYRCQLSVVSTTGTTLGCAIITDSGTGFAASSSSYTGTTNYILIAGAQLEPALYVAGKYTATTTAAAAQTVSFSATVGMIRRPTDPTWISNSVGSTTIGLNATGQGAERAFRCTTAGTTAAAEPSAAGGNPWTTKAAATVTDNAAVWTEVTGNESFQTAGSWAPFARLTNFNNTSIIGLNTITSFPAGGTGYVVGDIVAITGVTTPVDYPIIKVATISAGAILTATILDPGVYASGTTALTTTKLTGAGSGATVTVTTSNLSPYATGDVIYVGNQHCEMSATQNNPVLNGTVAQPAQVVSVDQSASGHIPPTSVDYLSGAIIAAASSQMVESSTSAEYNGITFKIATGTNSANVFFGNSGSHVHGLRDCQIIWAGSGGGVLQPSGFCRFTDVSLKFANTGNAYSAAGTLEWKNPSGVAALLSGGTAPTGGIVNANNSIGNIILEGVDFTNVGANRLFTSSFTFGGIQATRCVFPASSTVTAVGTVPAHNRTDIIQCDSGGLTLRNERYWTQGIMTTDTAVVRTGGATDGATAIGWKLATTANNARAWPFDFMRTSIYNSTTGSSVNVSVFGVCNVAAPTTADLWIEVDYLGTTSSTIGNISTQIPSNLVSTGTALTADTSAWDTAVTARANTTAYSVGNVIKTATNTGRIFICTTAGTSAGSEPAGYASAVDGGSVTDNTAVFRAGYRFKQTVAVTPRNAGLVHAIAKVATASTTGLFWIDPQIVLS